VPRIAWDALPGQLKDAIAARTGEVPADPGPLKRAEDRWKTWVADPGDALAFAGPALTHTDWAPDNVLIAPDRSWLIDWAWPTLGAAWTDPGCWRSSHRASWTPTLQASTFTTRL